MGVPWFKLDTNFSTDPKVELLKTRYGEKTAWFWLEIVAVSYEIEAEIKLFPDSEPTKICGAIDLKDDASRIHLEKRLNMRGARLKAVVDKCVECGLFEARWWEESQVISSERMIAQGEAMRNSIEAKRAAGRKSGESRRAKSTANNS